MMKFVSLLRGINVSGQKKIKMAELRSLFDSLGYENAQTYIQSGNVVFDSKGRSKSAIRANIEKGINQRFGFDVVVVVRDKNDLQRAIRHCPFGDIDLEKEASRVMVCFMGTAPEGAGKEAITQYLKDNERLIFADREAYLYCPEGHGKSKLSNNLLEKKLGVNATTRNWRTVNVLYDMCAQA